VPHASKHRWGKISPHEQRQPASRTPQARFSNIGNKAGNIMSSLPQQQGAIAAREIHVLSKLSARLLDIANAAKYLSVSVRTIRRMIADGELPFIQRHAARSPYLLDTKDLDRWIESSKQGGF
jgi:excisionase family DNA binding protein